MAFMSDECVSPHFEKGIKREDLNVFNSNPFSRISLESSIKILTLRRGFYDIPGHNGPAV